LVGFVDTFCEKYASEIAQITNEEKFQSAYSLIHDWFVFVPSQTAEIGGKE
jgi:hypothetical protein